MRLGRSGERVLAERRRPREEISLVRRHGKGPHALRDTSPPSSVNRTLPVWSEAAARTSRFVVDRAARSMRTMGRSCDRPIRVGIDERQFGDGSGEEFARFRRHATLRRGEFVG